MRDSKLRTAVLVRGLGVCALTLGVAFGCSSEESTSLRSRNPGAGGGTGGASTGGTEGPSADDPPPPFVPLAAEVYVSKVKNLLTGLPPTSEEIRAVNGDPTKLAGLVDQWMATPNFEEKMATFFQLSFQMSPVTAASLQELGVPRPPKADYTALYANIAEMVPRTAIDAMKSGRPFNELISTRSFMMTTALASFMAYVDRDQGALGKEAHTIYNTPTATLPAGGLAAADAVAGKTWFVDQPFANAKCTDPSTTQFHASDMLALMNGQLRCGDTTIAVTPMLTAADYTDWHLVEMTDAATADTAALFYDVPTLRTATKLPLAMKRAGFFTMPGFLQTWATNKDNLYRLTTNQTLIVALGVSIDGTDSTVPLTGLGAAATHVQAPCVGCHQIIEPMKNYFRQSMSITYRPQLDKTASTEAASFSLGGVSKSGGTIADFATTLASHPAVGSGWLQKLLYWSDSVGADPTDPEFQRLAAGFAASGYKWKQLVHDVMTSPLVTGAAATATFDKREFVVSLARRQHYGYALSKRLGIADPFLGMGNLPSNIPADEFARAAVEPALNATPGMFYRASVEAVCERLAAIVVDGPAPSKYASANSDAANVDMVTNVIGLPDADSRQSILMDALKAHYAAAIAAKAKPVDALRSTFTVACSSPVTAAIGL